MFTVPSGVPLDPLRSHAAFPYGNPTRPGVCPKWTATMARSTMLIAMSGAGSGPVSEAMPAEQAVQYQLTLPAWWNLCQPPTWTQTVTLPEKVGAIVEVATILNW